MKRPQLFFFVSLLLFLVCSYLLFSGSSLLEVGLGKNNMLPMGSMISWMLMFSLPFALYWGSIKFRKPNGPVYKILGKCLKVLVVLGILWLPLSYLLAGNLHFNFGSRDSFQGGQLAMKIFWGLSTGIPLTSLLILLLHALFSIFKS